MCQLRLRPIPLTPCIVPTVSTTIIHQAITSKGDTKARARVIRQILAIAPQAASVKNGYGSLPLHVISQRNTKLDAPTKEVLIADLVLAYKEALVEQGGVGKRTPLHIIFTGRLSRWIWRSMRVTRLLSGPSLTHATIHVCSFHRLHFSSNY